MNLRFLPPILSALLAVSYVLGACGHSKPPPPVDVGPKNPEVAPKVAISKLVKVLSWYDNEWGYSNRLIDTTLYAGGKVAAQRKRSKK